MKAKGRLTTRPRTVPAIASASVFPRYGQNVADANNSIAARTTACGVGKMNAGIFPSVVTAIQAPSRTRPKTMGAKISKIPSVSRRETTVFALALEKDILTLSAPAARLPGVRTITRHAEILRGRGQKALPIRTLTVGAGISPAQLPHLVGGRGLYRRC